MKLQHQFVGATQQSIKIHLSTFLDNRIYPLLVESFLLPLLQPAATQRKQKSKISSQYMIRDNLENILSIFIWLFGYLTLNFKMDYCFAHPLLCTVIPGGPECDVFCCWFMWLLTGLSYDGRNPLDAIRKVSLLTPAQLWGHQQFASLVDAVFVLFQNVWG